MSFGNRQSQGNFFGNAGVPGICAPVQDSPAGSLSLLLEGELASRQACFYCLDRGPPGESTGGTDV